MQPQELPNHWKGPLRHILLAELQAGNTITETWQGGWPRPGVTFVFLREPFRCPIQRDLPGVAFRNVNDPHYWKAEYDDTENNLILACNFGGIPNFDDL